MNWIFPAHLEGEITPARAATVLTTMRKVYQHRQKHLQGLQPAVVRYALFNFMKFVFQSFNYKDKLCNRQINIFSIFYKFQNFDSLKITNEF